MKNLFIILLILTSNSGFCQTDEVFVVTANKLNVRSGPSINSAVIDQLNQGQEVVVSAVHNKNWYKIDLGGRDAYIYSSLVTNDPDWIKINLFSGRDPGCENVTPSYDKELDNYLKVDVGSNTDVVIKLMKMNSNGTDHCIRIVYVRSRDSYKIVNIPEGKYYLKIAYGKDWRQKIIDNKCYGKFMRSPMYEKGQEILDFNVKKTPGGYSIPIYELELDVIATDLRDNFMTNRISEEEFNN